MPEKQTPRPGFVFTLFVLAVIAISAAVYFGRKTQPQKKSNASTAEVSKINPTGPPRNQFLSRKKNSDGEETFPIVKDSTITQLLAKLNDSALGTKARRAAGRALARTATAEALDAAKAALQNTTLPSAVKAAMAEGLGENSLPEARKFLETLLAEKDEAVARAAVRGLAAAGDAAAADTLLQVLSDAGKPESVRTEAALALGDLNQPGITASLIKAMSDIKDENISEFILEGLGNRPFDETVEFFRSYLANPDTSSELRVAAIDALQNSKGDPTALLMKYTADPNPEVRAAVGFSLAGLDDQGYAGGELRRLVAQETDSDVRKSFYSAFENQSDVDFAKSLAMVKNENDFGVKLAGLNLLAAAAKTNPDIADYFNQTAIAELKAAALNGERVQDRLSATMTLRKLNSAGSLNVLQEIAGQSTDPKVVQAANAALLPHPH